MTINMIDTPGLISTDASGLKFVLPIEGQYTPHDHNERNRTVYQVGNTVTYTHVMAFPMHGKLGPIVIIRNYVDDGFWKGMGGF